MQCNSCGVYMDADVYQGETSPDCLFCDGQMQYSATDYLSMPELGLVTEVRPTQLQLADQLQQAITQQQHTIVEAGTGVGKSFAYLLSAILNGRRVVITTAKKSLQSQLVEKDLPRLQELIGPALTFAPAYGKGNYGCRKAAMKAPKDEDRQIYAAFFDNAPTWHWDEARTAFNSHKKANPTLPLYQELPRDRWRYSAKECVGRECEHFKNKACEYMRAREKVAHSKVVVTNHWLLGYDIALRTGALGEDTTPVELLGDYHVLVVDEAHKFEEGFRTAFTLGVDEFFLKRTIDKYYESLDKIGDETPPQVPYENQLRQVWGDLFRKLDAAPGSDEATEISATFLGQEGQALMNQMRQALARAESPAYLDALFGGKGSAIAAYFKQPNAPLPVLDSQGMDKLFIHRKLTRAMSTVVDMLDNAFSMDDNFVTFLEKGDEQRPNAINVSPIRMGGYLQGTFERLDSVTFISATLAVNGTFVDFERRVGLDRSKWEARLSKGVYGSSFDYKKQAVLYLSPHVPQATYKRDQREEYRNKLAEEIWDLVHASNGCAFVLFTSRVEMDHVYDHMVRRGISLPVLRQAPGMSPAELLKRYRASDNPVLLGLKSFWEGVDVQGDQLQLVIIAKLPFPGRSDPIVSARREREGNDWFSRVDLPDMVLDLRQGVGRLIRSQDDRGVIAILDQRLLTKRYKNRVLRSLGMKNITKNKDATLRALRNLASKR